MGTQRFNIGQQFTWHGELFEVRQLMTLSQLAIVNLTTNERQLVTFNILYEALLEDELQFTILGQQRVSVQQPHCLDLSDYPEALRHMAEYRLDLIRPLLKLSASQRHTAIIQRVQVEKTNQANQSSASSGLSEASIYRWLKDYLDSGGDIRALLPNVAKRGGKHKMRLDPAVEAVIQGVIDDFYYRREVRTIDTIYYEIVLRIKEANQHRPSNQQLEPPSRASVGRRIAARDEVGKLVAKRGKQHAKRALTQYKQIEYPTMPLEKVEIDHTLVDLIVIDEADNLPLGRLTLTYCLDTATRYPLGFYLSFEPPSYLSVMECLYHAILPKGQVKERYQTAHDWQAYGVPFHLVVDNAKEFIGRDLEDACLSLGTVLEQTPVKTPHFKATVERMFGTMNTGLLHGLPGTTFSNPDQRGDYHSLQHACICLNDLEQMLHIFLLDQYAESFHRGLSGIPARQWEAATQAGFFPRVPASAEMLRILLGRVAYRTVQPYGIELFALRYQSDDLTGLRTRMHKQDTKQVKIKYHPADLSRIYAFDPDEKRYIEVPALAQAYTANLSLWKHNVIREFARSQQDTVDVIALAEAQRKIQAIVDESLQRKKRQTHRRAARWQHSGSTPSLSEGATTSSPDQDQTAVQEDTAPAELRFPEDLPPTDASGWSVDLDLPDVPDY